MDPTEVKRLMVETAQELGISPVDLATVISYETGGTFDPTQGGPTTKWGRHRGYIQFGEPQSAKYGVDFSTPETAVYSQLGKGKAVSRYLRDAGVRPGSGLLDVYSAINAGGVGRNNAVDMNTPDTPTVASKVSAMGPHQEKAKAFFGGTFQPATTGGTGMLPPGYAETGGSVLPPIPTFTDEPVVAEEETNPYSLLASTLASHTGSRGPSEVAVNSLGPSSSQPELEYTSAVPEGPPPAVKAPTSSLAADASGVGALADIFKIREFGKAGYVDPYTGAPGTFRSRRTYG